MERDIKDYLHLYIGCQVKRTDMDDYGWALVGVSASEVEPGRTVAIIGGPVFQEWYAEETRPILRPLSDMTEEERKECGYINVEGIPCHLLTAKPQEFIYLLSRGFDLFNLIPDGLAIDTTTISKPV